MMYAFGNRSDFTAWDEPFYSAYLAKTGLDHPMREAILASQSKDPNTVVKTILDPEIAQTPNRYFKLMTHHMLDDVPLDWAKDCVNVHLIRHPARVIASYGAKHEDVTAEGIGFQRQAELYEALGGVVIDSFDIRQDPKQMLEKLCENIGLEFDASMLRWAAGSRAYDGVWAKHWYGAVHTSTGFAGGEGPLPELSGRDATLCKDAMRHYETLAAAKL